MQGVPVTAPVRLGPGFWRVWIAATVSELGSGLTYVALPLLTVTLTRDPRQGRGSHTGMTI